MLMASTLRMAGYLSTCENNRLPFFDNLDQYAGGSARSNYTFLTQKEHDNETGLDYFGARYYSSMQGRFTGVDIADPNLVNPQSLNKDAYTLNNPLRYVVGVAE